MNDLFTDSQKGNSICSIVPIYQQMLQKLESMEINWKIEESVILFKTVNMQISFQVALGWNL